jgi:hypothetical protein
MVVIDYDCGVKLVLLRGIRRGTPWTIRAVRIGSTHQHPFIYRGWVAIKTAWYGGNDPLSHKP